MAQPTDQVIVGHESVWKRLNQLKDLSKLPTAMAFVGPEGIGKSLVAKSFAKSLGSSMESGSLLWIQPSGEWIKVEQIHDVLRKLSLRSLTSYRIVVIEEAEKLNAQSSNALLKALEEPPDQTHFILITSSLARMLPTIRSRVQSFRFFPLSTRELQELSPEAPSWALNASRGQVSELEDWQSEEISQFLSEAENGFLALGKQDLEGWLNLFPLIKDRANARRMAKTLQFFFRDLVAEVNEDEQTLPFSGRLRPYFSWPSHQLAKAWEKAFELEMSIAQNGDRSLLFQNYFYDIHGT